MVDLILKDLIDRDPKELSDSELDSISRTLTIREIQKALLLAFKRGKMSNVTDDDYT